MARLPRFNIVGLAQHVIIRGNNREPIFYSDEDYLFYLEKLQQACVKHECELHAYVLMTNYVHLLITPNKKSMGSDSIDLKQVTGSGLAFCLWGGEFMRKRDVLNSRKT